jgi:hypothetical protein
MARLPRPSDVALPRSFWTFAGLLSPKNWLPGEHVFRHARPDPKMKFLLSLMEDREDLDANDAQGDSEGYGG